MLTGYIDNMNLNNPSEKEEKWKQNGRKFKEINNIPFPDNQHCSSFIRIHILFFLHVLPATIVRSFFLPAMQMLLNTSGNWIHYIVTYSVHYSAQGCH